MTLGYLEIPLVLAALGLLVPSAVLFLECAASLWPAPQMPLRQGPRSSVVVVVPAHNEAACIETSLASLRPQLAPGDRLIVVADNCIDDTAARARGQGAMVLERNDPARHGKGYALLHALDAIEAVPFDVVVMVDGDCVADPGLVETLACAVVASGRPAQAAYRPRLPPDPGRLDQISALAFITKNVTRPRGLARLGLPCLLTGSGMAFPWHVIRKAPIAGGKTAEDMRLAVDLSMAGYPPAFCPEARLAGPLHRQGVRPTLQRARWEHGHLETLIGHIGPLLLAAIRQRRLDLLAIGLDLGVPPLSLWALLWAPAAALAGGLALVGGSRFPLGLLLTSGILMTGSVLLAWARDGRSLVSARALLVAAVYALGKLPLYLAFSRRPQAVWGPTGSVSSPGPRTPLAGAVDAAPMPLTVRIGPARLHAISEANVVARVFDRLQTGEGGWILTLNLDHLWRLERDPEYAVLCARATVAVADGMPLVWASRLQGTPLPERVAGSDLVSSLSAAAAHHHRSVALVGGLPDAAEATADVLRARHPGLRVAGVLSASEGQDRAGLVESLRTMGTDIVYLSLGKIAEERLIDHLRERMPAVWFIGVGSSFAFLAGHLRRAPRWMRAAGLEWLHRWTQEPTRLTGRYCRCIPFAIRLLADAALQGARRRIGRQ